jgi:hypothetical protein
MKLQILLFLYLMTLPVLVLSKKEVIKLPFEVKCDSVCAFSYGENKLTLLKCDAVSTRATPKKLQELLNSNENYLHFDKAMCKKLAELLNADKNFLNLAEETNGAPAFAKDVIGNRVDIRMRTSFDNDNKEIMIGLSPHLPLLKTFIEKCILQIFLIKISECVNKKTVSERGYLWNSYKDASKEEKEACLDNFCNSAFYKFFNEFSSGRGN